MERITHKWRSMLRCHNSNGENIPIVKSEFIVFFFFFVHPALEINRK